MSLIFEMSQNTRLLRQHLRAIKVGETATYAELSKVVGEPVDGGSACLQSAIGSLLRKDEMVFACIRGVGFKRLNDEEIVDSGDHDVDALRRRARRAARKLIAVKDYSAMPANKQIMHTARLSLMTAVAHMTTDASVKKIEGASAGHKELPIKETLAAFGLPN